MKPWLEPTHHGVYSRLLRRLLIGEDLAIRVPEQQVPLRLRRPARAPMPSAKRVNARERLSLARAPSRVRRTAARRGELS